MAAAVASSMPSSSGASGGGGMSSMTTTLNMRAHMNKDPQTATAKASKTGVVLPSSSTNTNGALLDKIMVPLSSRRADPLDLNTVERRGYPSAVNEEEASTKPARPHGLQEAPTFRPSEEDWKSPTEYIRKIAPVARPFGICKIIPPDGWNPDLATDTERFHFRTRRQKLNLAEGDTRANLNYLDQLAKFHMQRNGTNLNRFPSVDKRPLDLYKLKRFVEEKGGFEAVCRQKRWAEIGRDLGYSGKIMSSLSTSLKNSYQKWLSPYEDWLKHNKANILQQQEIENGGPYTPSPAPTPAKAQHQPPMAGGAASPAIRASTALNAALIDVVPPPSAIPAPATTLEQTPLSRPIMSSGFTPVNPGGFTAVNAPAQQAVLPPPPPPLAAPSSQPAYALQALPPKVAASHSASQPTSYPPSHVSSFAAVNAPNGFPRPETAQSTPQRSEISPLTSVENTPEMPQTAHQRFGPVSVLNFNGIKRGLSSEDIDMEAGLSGDVDANGRSSKRVKKEAVPVVAGSSMVQPRLPGPRLQLPRDRSKEIPGDICEECSRGDDDTAILICDNCDSGYHRYCLRPPLKSVPDYDWFCPRCLFGRGEYGFEEGAVYSLKQFQERARYFKDSHFANKMSADPTTNKRRVPSEDEVEREFWRLTESLTETVEVEYGADIHSTTHGSGFPTLELQASNPYATDPWNLNILPLDKESLFRHIKTDISGMTVPWLYVGMVFSTFCWHSEDHYTYSANYQHFGDTKTWYGIPGEDAEKFEAAMREKIPEMFEQQPDLLFQLVTLFQPEKLRKAGVRVYALDQRAGQMVITFPQAYHAGFNHGFNFNEAVNFAPSDWEPYGAASIIRLQDYRRQPVFCHEELLLSAAARDHTIATAKWLGPALQRMLDREMKSREDFTIEYTKAKNGNVEGGEDNDSVIGSNVDFPFEKGTKDFVDDDMVCSYCKAFCFLSRFMCKKTGRLVCLAHAGKFECCENVPVEDRTSLKDESHSVQLHMTDEELATAVQKVVDVSKTPELWADKLDKLLEDGPSPQLKTLRSLVAEGERINQHWSLPQLPELRKYVERCNEWVEEATNYITRKLQNRRKNERVWRKSSLRASDVEDRERELRNVDNIKRLLKQAEDLAFECPELETLQERADKIEEFRERAFKVKQAVNGNRAAKTVAELEELIEDGKAFGVDIPEVEELEGLMRRLKWYESAFISSKTFDTDAPLSLGEVEKFLAEGRELGLSDRDDFMAFFQQCQQQGMFWEQKVKELMSAEPINYLQLDTFADRATRLAVHKETLAQIDVILAKQREAREKIETLYQRCRDPEFRNRPKYAEVRDAMESLAELNNKPPGTMDLEKEQKRHEDWMRRGKKLFGKANAPLHILLQHMKIVEERNESCLDLADEPRLPVEPSSRANSPVAEEESDPLRGGREVFCICRKSEAGMMIECEMCHEWYHGRCLKIARGKVKEDDKYTCPICDHRVKIPRDAARPRLEDLLGWQDELDTLPFQPEEEECLASIINKASDFRTKLVSIVNPIMSTPDDLPVQRFYLRKIEGADVLLASETNFLRQELHKWAPVAPEPPRMIEMSLSTRKPRPTKQQKLMQQLGLTNPDDLPVHLRPKQPGTKKKEKDDKKPSDRPSKDLPPSHTPPGLPHGHANAPTPSSSLASSMLLSQPRPSHQLQHPVFSYDALADSRNTYSEMNSPMFSTAASLSHHRGPARPIATSPSLQPHGIDPSLENMFGRPSSSGNDGGKEHGGASARFDLTSPPLRPQPLQHHHHHQHLHNNLDHTHARAHHDAPADKEEDDDEANSDSIDLFASLTNDARRDDEEEDIDEKRGLGDTEGQEGRDRSPLPLFGLEAERISARGAFEESMDEGFD